MIEFGDPRDALPLASIEAEQAILGASMVDLAGWHEAQGLRPEHFFEPFHQRLWSAICARAEAGEMPECVLLASHFAGDPAYNQLGGPAYLVDLVDKAPPPRAARPYARQVIELGLRRQTRKLIGDASASLGRTAESNAYDLLAELRRGLDALEAEAAAEDVGMVRAPDLAEAVIAELAEAVEHGRTRGRMTGLRCIDRRLGGLLPGKLIVIGGRPGMGKTALARAIAHGCAVHNPDHDALFLGIEMGPQEMMQRELSALTFDYEDEGVEYNLMARAKLTRAQVQTLRRVRSLVPPNLIFDDCPRLSVEDVRRKAWALARKRKLALIVIDYLQLMQRPPARGRNEASVLGEITATLKQIARQTGVAILLLSQLSRGVESRDDKRPQLADLRESGAIEQDADVVLFPYREHYYLSRAEPAQGTGHNEWLTKCELVRYRLDVGCAKQRQGPEGTDRQEYHPEFDAIFDGAD